MRSNVGDMVDHTRVLSAREFDYLASQRVGRLATVCADGSPHVVPVGFWCTDGTINIGGPRMGRTQKYRNIQQNPRVCLVLDDHTPDDETDFAPGLGRGLQIRGRAEALTDQDLPEALANLFSTETIRLHPEHAVSWHVDPARPGLLAWHQDSEQH